MGYYLELVDTDKLYTTIGGLYPHVVLNDLENETDKQKEFVTRNLITEINTDSLSNLPSCECGALVGEDNLDLQCQECGTYVTKTIEDLEYRSWIRAPFGVKSLINLHALNILFNTFNEAVIDALCGIKVNKFKDHELKLITQVKQDLRDLFGIETYSLNNFITHFDKILLTLINNKTQLTAKSGYSKRKALERYFFEDIDNKVLREGLFPRFIPVINKSLIILEKAPMETHYMEKGLSELINPIRNFVSMDVNLDPRLLEGNPEDKFYRSEIKKREDRTYKSLKELAFKMEGLLKSQVSKKTGIFRRSLFGVKAMFSMRTVTTSIAGPHNAGHVYLPWSLSVTMYRLHIVNKLLKMGLTANEAAEVLVEAESRYIPEIDKIFDELIKECPFPGLPVLVNRNPTLKRGSINLFYVSKIKKNADDKTISVSVINLRTMNCDFDGDQLNVISLLDNYLAKGVEPFAPYNNIMDLSQALSVTSAHDHTKAVVAAQNTFLHFGQKDNPMASNSQLMKELT